MSKIKLSNVIILLSVIITLLVICTVLLIVNTNKSTDNTHTSVEDVVVSETDNISNDNDNVTYVKSGPDVSIYENSAWLQYCDSQYFTDTEVYWRELDGMFKGSASDAEYYIDITYVPIENSCIIYILNPEDMNDVIAEFRS